MAARDRKKVARRRGGSADRRRLEKITRALEAMVGGDLDRQLPVSPAGDQLDAISYSVNILVGELAFATANVRRAQAEAEAANAAKSKFLRTASHELRTPLAVIVWLTELLRDPERVPPERFAARWRASAAAPRSCCAPPRPFSICRVSTTRTTRPNPRSSTSPRRVREALENLQPLAERKQIGLRLAMGPGVPATLRTNGQHFRQVIVNLVANAIKFTVQGEVVVRVQRADGALAIDVEDTGIGIPEGAQARIFEPFFQVDRAAAKKLGGSGVGLALAKRFVEKLKGNAVAGLQQRGRRIDVPVHAAARHRVGHRRGRVRRTTSRRSCRCGRGRSRGCVFWSPTTRS